MKDKIKRFTKKYLNIKYILPFVLIFSLSFAMLFSANADYVTVTTTADRFGLSAYPIKGNTVDFVYLPVTSVNASLSSKMLYFDAYPDREVSSINQYGNFDLVIYFPRSFPTSDNRVDFSFWYASNFGISAYDMYSTGFYYRTGLYTESSDGNEVDFAWNGEFVRSSNHTVNKVTDAANNGYPASGAGFVTSYYYYEFSLPFISNNEFNVIAIRFDGVRGYENVRWLFNNAVIQSTYYDDGSGGDTSSDTSSDTDTDTDTDSGGIGGGDTSSGGGGSINWPETDQPEVDNGLNDANSGLHDVENELNSAFDDVYSDVDLDIDNVITDDILSSTYFFSQMLGTCFDGLPWLNTMVTVSLVIGGIAVLLGFFKRSG